MIYVYACAPVVLTFLLRELYLLGWRHGREDARKESRVPPQLRVVRGSKAWWHT